MKISLMALVAAFCLVVGLPLAAMAGPTPGSGLDADNQGSTPDGVEDAFDNCIDDGPPAPVGDNTTIYEANPNQRDCDHDGCGNRCDADYNQDGAHTPLDFAIFANGYFGTECNLDFDGDGVVGPLDFAFFADNYFGRPGPSGFPASQRTGGCTGPNP